MKRFKLVVAALFLTAAAYADEEKLRASESELLTKLFQLSVSAESANGNDRAHEAACAEVLSDADYKAICRDLEGVSGIEMSRNNSRVRIVGEIVDPAEWTVYRRVVKRYSALVSDYAVFRPGPQLIESLRQQLVSLGFEVADEASPEKPGVLSIKFESGVLRLEGWFLSKADIDSIRGVVAMRSWLSTEADAADGCVPCEMRLQVVDRLIDVGVVFVQISKDDAVKFGNTICDGRILDFQTAANFAKAFQDFIPSLVGDKGQKNGGYVRVSSDISGVIDAFASDRLFMTRSSGHMTLDTNDMEKRSKFHKGGKMILKISGEVTGGDTEEVEYGFTIDCLGRFIRQDELALDIQLEDSSKPEREENSTDYDQKKIDLNTHIACRLGQTVILAGAHEISDNEQGPSGFAFLRKIPILGWIFAGASEERSDEHLLILISPTLLKSDTQLAEKPSAENEKLDDEVKPRLKGDVEERVGVWRWYEIFYFWKWGW